MRRRGHYHRVASVGLLLALAGCTSASNEAPGRTASRSGTPSASASSAVSPPANDRVVWLCRPNHRPDPCTSSTQAIEIVADGTQRVETPPGAHRRADCFYAYPTVSRQPRPNADLTIEQTERDVARAQASRFSNVCDVWAPIYRQRTVGGLLNPADRAPDSVGNLIAYRSLRKGWRAFLAERPRRGRPIVVIGHSQGAAMLTRLLRAEVDHHPALRQRLALALLIGANVTVATGQVTGGSFDRIPLCTHPEQAGCVIAYSSFPGEPPDGAFFGRPGTGVSALSGETGGPGLSVACVNPAGIGRASALLSPYFPTKLADSGVGAPWTAYPDRYTGSCRHGDGASWLQVTSTDVPGDERRGVTESLGPLWGYHVTDVNLALGDLVTDTASAVHTWQSDGRHCRRCLR